MSQYDCIDWIGYLGKIDPSIIGEFRIQNPQTVCNISETHDTYGAIMV